MSPDRSLHPDRTTDHEPAASLPPETVDLTGAGTVPPGTSAPPPDAPAVPGYALTAELARGGMGRVYAGRDLTLDREVAIKTLLPGASGERFVTESKIAARLPHPNIPPVHALGTLPDGSPYLVMKLIRGRTLEALLKERASPADGLPRWVQVFEQIAQAVGFAHASGVIHRDLKPLNVMVGEFGEVQVMDWGLAKSGVWSPESGVSETRLAATRSGALDPEFTQAGAVMGTPGYMAPEQARGEPVDARADVFALGATLAAVLTGKPAFVGKTAVETIGKAAKADLADVLARLDGCGADAELVALAKRCLSVSVTDRPADGRAVAADVAAYRAGVEARLRRAETERAEALVREAEGRKRRRQFNRAAAVVAGVLLLGVVGTSIGFWQAHLKAEDERRAKIREGERADGEAKAKTLADEKRELAERNLGFSRKNNTILGSVFTGLDAKVIAESGRPLQDILRENLGLAVKELDGAAIGDPLAVAEMQHTLGQSLEALGDHEQAVGLFARARDTRTAALGRDHPDTLSTVNNLAAAYLSAGRLDDALTLSEETLARMKVARGPDHAETLTCMNNLANVYHNAGKHNKALPLYEVALALRKANLGPEHPNTLGSMNNLAECYRDAGKLDKALPLHEEAFALLKAALGRDHPDTLSSAGNLALTYRTAGKLDKAFPLLEETLALRKAKLGPDHPDTLYSMNTLAAYYSAAGKLDKAVPLFEETFALRKTKLGRDHPSTLATMSNLAEGYRVAGEIDKAVPLYEESLAVKKTKLGLDHPNTLTAMNDLANGYRAAKRVDKAVPLYEEAFARMKAKLGPDHPDTLTCMGNLAGAYEAVGKLDKAVPLHEETLALKKVKHGPDHPNTIAAVNNLATAYQAAGRLTDALPLFDEAARGVEKYRFQLQAAGPIVRNAVRAFEAAGQLDKAEGWRRKLLATVKAQGPNTPAYASELVQLADNLSRQGKLADAESALRECLAVREKSQPDAWTTFNTQAMLGEVLRRQKKYADAEPLLVKGYEGLKAREKTIPPGSSARIPEALDRLIDLYAATGKPDEVRRWRAERAKYPFVAPPPRPK